MSPELSNNRQSLSRHRVVAVMTAAQEDAMAQLRREGIPETQALLVMQRISSFCLQTLRELDLVYREFEELLAQNPDRSAAHQEWLDTKAGGMLLTLEACISALVAEAINKAQADYRSELSKPREVITTVPASPRPPAWQQALVFLDRTRESWLLAVCSGIWFLLWTVVTGSPLWGLAAVGVAAVAVFFLQWVGLLCIFIAAVCFIFLV
jgi:hypothetical protein